MLRNSTRAFSALGLMLAAMAVASCGSDDGGSGGGTDTGGSDGGAEKVRIAYLSYGYTDFHQAEEIGMKNVVEKDGGSVTVMNAAFDPQKQLKQCQDAIASGRYDGIVLAPVDSAAGVPCAREAEQADIPVVALESAIGPDPAKLEPQVPGVVGSVINSEITNADGLNKLVQQACDGIDPCEVIAEVATPSDRFTNKVIEKVKADGGSNVEIVAEMVGQYDPSLIAKGLPDLLRAHRNADVFLSAADTQALAALPALKDAGMDGKVKLIGNGGSRLGVKAVADGTMFATLGNWPEQMGEIAAKDIVAALNGEEIAEPAVDGLKIDEPFYVYEDEAASFKAEWGAE